MPMAFHEAFASWTSHHRTYDMEKRWDIKDIMKQKDIGKNMDAPTCQCLFQSWADDMIEKKE